MSSWALSTYEGRGSTITMHLCNVNLVDRSTFHLCDRISGSQRLHSIFVFCFDNPTKLLMKPCHVSIGIVLIKIGKVVRQPCMSHYGGLLSFYQRTLTNCMGNQRLWKNLVQGNLKMIRRIQLFWCVWKQFCNSSTRRQQ